MVSFYLSDAGCIIEKTGLTKYQSTINELEKYGLLRRDKGTVHKAHRLQ